MHVSKVVREYITKVLTEHYEKALKTDAVIAEWDKISKKKDQLLEQLQEEFGEKTSEAFSSLGFEGANFHVYVHDRGWRDHPAAAAACERREQLSKQYREAVDNILLELELSGATKKDLEAMLSKVTFGE